MLPLLLISAYSPMAHCDQDLAQFASSHVGVDDLRTLMQYRPQCQQGDKVMDYAGALWKLLQTKLQDDGDLAIALQWRRGRSCNDEQQAEEEEEILNSASLRMELDFALWNLAAACSSKSAGPAPATSSKLEWNSTSKNLQTAASFLHYCTLPDASLYEMLFIAEGQRCVYQAFACQPRPKHFLLAKLCMTVANIYTVLEEEYELENEIADAVRAWGMYITALAEYHQSLVEQPVGGPAAAARLENARKFASFCADFLETCDIEIPELGEFLNILDSIPQSSVDADGIMMADELFDLDELPEIPAQPAVIKVNTSLESMLTIPTSLFRTMKQDFQPLLTQFQSSLQAMVNEKARLVERKTETARTALQSVHLPQSITAYTNAEQTLRTSHRDDTSELQRSAEAAWALVARIDRMIDNNNDHDPDDSSTVLPRDIATTFRNALTQYKTLLEKAAASDIALRERPLPKVPTTTPKIVTELSQSLFQLSVLFHERDDAVQKLRSSVEQLQLKEAIRTCETEEQVRSVFENVKTTLQEKTSMAAFDQNFEQQSKLLYQIMQENDRFQRDEDLAMLEDAVSQYDRFARHLHEGLGFYQNILPKLKKLDAQVLEVCERLSEERTVDDEKVANLVAMDFEFEKVVNALRKHDNNLEQALNDLLSC